MVAAGRAPCGLYQAVAAGVGDRLPPRIQEVFGVNPHIKKITDAFAAKGYVAIAPALFDSIKPGVELGYDDESLAEGVSLMKQVGKERALGEIQAAVDAGATLSTHLGNGAHRVGAHGRVVCS